MENIMILHETSDTFRNAIRAASDHLGIRDVFIEKDYWVTYILKRLSESEYSENVVFKGGTSLSKVYKLIARFSEDVDLAILKSDFETETQVRILIRKIEKELTTDFEEVILEGITSKQTKYRKTAYNYNKLIELKTESGIQEKLILEINSFANPVPFKRMPVDSWIAQYFNETNNILLIGKYNLEPFTLNVLVPESTLIEKMLSLIRMSYFEDRLDKLKSKVRHFYDIYFLSTSTTCKEYIDSENFKKDFDRLFEEDKTKFNDPVEWLASKYNESPIFTEFDEIWNNIKKTYNTDFRLLVHGQFPDENLITEEFRAIVGKLVV